MFDCKLYPYQAVTFFRDHESAIAYAEEIWGYRQLWEIIGFMNESGIISPN
jgi:hypothetical protein